MAFLKIVIGLYFLIALLLYVFQEKLLFFPSQLEQDYTYQFNYPFEELFLKPKDNVVINGLHFKAENPKGVILYFHGNAGDLSGWGDVATYFVEKHYDVLIIDYRAYGKSKGKLSETAFYTDAQYCYDYLLKQYAEDEVTIYGRSLGTGIASYLASKNKAKQLILETPYYGISDVAQKRFPIIPVKLLLKYHFPTYEYLPKVNCPITIIHGTSDTVVLYNSAEKLTKLGVDLNFITVEDGGHNNLSQFKMYHDIIETLL